MVEGEGLYGGRGRRPRISQRWAPILGMELMALPGPIAPHIHKVIHYKCDELEGKFVPTLTIDHQSGLSHVPHI